MKDLRGTRSSYDRRVLQERSVLQQ